MKLRSDRRDGFGRDEDAELTAASITINNSYTVTVIHSREMDR